LQSIELILSYLLSLVRLSMNTQCPVNRLPPELLSHIMHHASLHPGAGGSGEIWRPRIHSLHVSRTVSHVCHYWRDVALSTANLWSTIGSRLPWVAIPMFIERSGTAPLDVEVETRLTMSHSGSLLRTLQAHGSRIQSLHCVIMDMKDPSFLKLLAFRPQRLQTLSIICDTGTRFRRPDPEPGPFLFEDYAPRLSQLSLHYVHTLPSNRFESLTRLCLVDALVYDESSLLTFLSYSVRLEDLVLVGIQFSLPTANIANNDAQPLALRHLRKLAFAVNAPSFVMSILSRLALPSHLALYLSSIWAGGLPVLPPLGLLDPVTKLKIEILAQNVKSFTAAGPSSALRVTQARKLVGDRERHGPTALLDMAPIPMSNITELWIDIQGRGIGAGSIRERLRSMSSLTTIIGDKRVLDIVCKVMFIAATNASAQYGSLCPALRGLHCIKGLPDLSILTEFAKSRDQCGFRLRCLTVEGVSADDSARLRESSLSRHIDSLEVRGSTPTTTMELPTMCTDEMHRYWEW